MATGSTAYSPIYRVLIRVSETYPRMERKLQKYFQNPWRSGGGKCKVKFGPREGTFWVEFYKRQAKEGVIAKGDHSVPVTDTSYVNVFIEASEGPEENNTLEASQLSFQPLSLPKEFPDEKHPDEGGAPSSSKSFIQKIFLHVEAQMNFKLSKELSDTIINLCPNLKIEEDHDGPEKVIGDYEDIEKMYLFLSEKMLGNDQEEDFAHSASAREIEHIMPNDYNSPNVQSNLDQGTEEELDLISIPSHLYEYFKYFFAETLDRIESEHQVRIKSTLAYPTGNVFIEFETRKSSDRKAAQEAFTRAFQREIENVSRQDIHFTDNQLALDVQKTLTGMFQNLHIKAEGKVLMLWGNPQDISGAQHFIESNLSRKEPVEMMVSQNMMQNQFEIDTAHLRLLYQEIREIEKKYDTVVELLHNPQTEKTLIVFKPKDKGLDLSTHACEVFIDIFQMLIPQIAKEVVILKSLDQEKKLWPEKTFFEDFDRKHPCVNLEWNGQELTLTGLPKYLEEAMKYVKRYFNIEDTAQQRQGPALSFGANWNRESRSPLDKYGDDFNMLLPPFNGLSSFRDLGKEEDEDEEEEDEEEEECVICMGVIRQKEVLPTCKHGFCSSCIREAMKHKPVCPVCQTSYGIMKGNQPDGTMTTSYRTSSLPGYNSYGTIVIHYDMRGGIQTEEHPNPGKRFEGTRRVAYLPNNEEGRQVLHLLRRAFDQRLIFTIGQSRTSGVKDVITWNDIHHKTLQFGGPENFGYPDPNYLPRVKMELKAKGIE
ncbi:E3 ubiquitin-protein ligase DTX3L-like [Dromiciops gliroides]|uniref:E3 ubiquitin-protein ligase DTX3L-like n=1 Tax=Dromiciops gliroides TaxID=33562 RepID=UPI001CC7BBBE|nr:E3 ubiquitin-protein ligase DTX3L-like [Dromiciops gliroides]XP_043829970.1 E3 ubiquitin-protein ligase DTX3L-like [Dromiciops gliroides]XP_043829971.1 E3 ubiquitin-protein ligase DTX3L-like [Dromiciops gliroides]XP_043829972.1 E3 ubiquitin-protein ligase DTX3L-like [Dromiciops gliroides]XP_043829973.1 E3 ubiquitin-protein ligase DTX3L-like [Dromiciops gliroides]XP_043829974.1 E3 ubiquitin-protein ligase DTX3L-like [Dromiciops gliroides]XP_043829975.1 E3 ubiquitin-protein ligase DTX3L-like